MKLICLCLLSCCAVFAQPLTLTGLPTGGANCSQYDGVHPTDAGHAIIAGAFERAFR